MIVVISVQICTALADTCGVVGGPQLELQHAGLSFSRRNKLRNTEVGDSTERKKELFS